VRGAGPADDRDLLVAVLPAVAVGTHEGAVAPQLREARHVRHAVAHADGHDWIYVLSGRLRLVLGDDDFVLKPGEAAEFSCRTPHWLGAVDGPAEAVGIFGPQGERIHTR